MSQTLTKDECERRLKIRQKCTDALTRLSRIESETNEVKDFLLRLRTDVLGDDLTGFCNHCANWNENPMMCAACRCHNTESERIYFSPEQYEH